MKIAEVKKAEKEIDELVHLLQAAVRQCYDVKMSTSTDQSQAGLSTVGHDVTPEDHDVTPEDCFEPFALVRDEMTSQLESAMLKAATHAATAAGEMYMAKVKAAHDEIQATTGPLLEQAAVSLADMYLGMDRLTGHQVALRQHIQTHAYFLRELLTQEPGDLAPAPRPSSSPRSDVTNNSDAEQPDPELFPTDAVRMRLTWSTSSGSSQRSSVHSVDSDSEGAGPVSGRDACDKMAAMVQCLETVLMRRAAVYRQVSQALLAQVTARSRRLATQVSQPLQVDEGQVIPGHVTLDLELKAGRAVGVARDVGGPVGAMATRLGETLGRLDVMVAQMQRQYVPAGRAE